MKVSYEDDNHELTKLSYKKLFKLSIELIKENDDIKNRNLDLKNHLEFLEKITEMLKYDITNTRNLVGTCETCVLMKKEVKDLH